MTVRVWGPMSTTNTWHTSHATAKYSARVRCCSLHRAISKGMPAKPTTTHVDLTTAAVPLLAHQHCCIKSPSYHAFIVPACKFSRHKDSPDLPQLSASDSASMHNKRTSEHGIVSAACTVLQSYKDLQLPTASPYAYDYKRHHVVQRPTCQVQRGWRGGQTGKTERGRKATYRQADSLRRPSWVGCWPACSTTSTTTSTTIQVVAAHTVAARGAPTPTKKTNTSTGSCLPLV